MHPVILTRYITFVLASVVIALNSWFIYYMHELKKNGCKCALSWRRTFIEACLVIQIALSVTSLFVNFGATKYHLYVLVAINAINLAYVIVARQFIHNVKHGDCKCADAKALTVLNWYNWFQIVSLIVGIVITFVAIAFVGVILKRSSDRGIA